MAFRGRRRTLHGAFKSLRKADRKAKKRHGWVLKRTIRGKRRYVVLTGKKRR